MQRSELLNILNIQLSQKLNFNLHDHFVQAHIFKTHKWALRKRVIRVNTKNKKKKKYTTLPIKWINKQNATVFFKHKNARRNHIAIEHSETKVNYG